MPLLQWCRCCCTGFFAVVGLVSSPLLPWHCCRCCTGVIALNALVSSPLLRWCLCCTTRATTLVQQWQRRLCNTAMAPSQQRQRGQCNNGHRCHCNNGKEASAMMFLLHQWQNTMHCHHRCTLLLFCQGHCRLARHPPTTITVFLFVVYVAASSTPFSYGWLLCAWQTGSDIADIVITSGIVVVCYYHLPPLPTRSVGQRCAREEEGMVAIALLSIQRHCHVVEGRAKPARGCFHGCHHQQHLQKQCFFVRMAISTRKTKIGDCQCMYN
jgi:hypothetical protein